MSIDISIGNKKISIYDDTKDLSKIDYIERYVYIGCDLIILLVDTKNIKFYRYEYKYLLNSSLNRKKWLLTNILYSILCDKTQQNMPGAFDDIVHQLSIKYENARL